MRFFNYLTVLIFSLLKLSTVQSQSEFVSAGTLGLIEGSIASTIGRSARNYSQFLGIPYAYPPARFQPSVIYEGPLSGDTGVAFNATSYGSECPQPTGTGSEICLFLNVFTPQLPAVDNSTELLPVIVFIHGAAFVSGNANAYTGARLLNRDVILITFNYRLGVFGFLNLQMPEAPGNAALYDALTCLEWVQKYISYFGGDPNRITLVGQSSGSATVSQLLVSPRSQGLFHGVIAASGSALDVWATARNAYAAATEVAAFVGCYAPGDLPPAVRTCLMALNQSMLTNAQNLYQYEDRKGGNIGFGAVCPSLQTFLTDNSAILPQHPNLVLESGAQMNVPLMMGTTRDDGGFALRLIYEGYIQPNNLIDDTNFFRNDLIPTIIKAVGLDDSTNAIGDAYQKLYLTPESISTGNFLEMAPGLIDMMGVLFFKSASYRTSQLHQKLNAGTFFYSFDYEGRFSHHPPSVPFPGGVAHADDLIYLFQMSPEFNAEELNLSEIMVDYWVNFATSGDPNNGTSTSANLPVWSPLEPENNRYLRIDNGGIASVQDYPGSWVIANKPQVVSPATPPSSATLLSFNTIPTLLIISMLFCWL